MPPARHPIHERKIVRRSGSPEGVRSAHSVTFPWDECASSRVGRARSSWLSTSSTQGSHRFGRANARPPCAVSLRGWRSEWAGWWSIVSSTGPVDPCWCSTAPASTTARLRLASIRRSTASQGCGGSIPTSLEWVGQARPARCAAATTSSPRCSTSPTTSPAGSAYLLIGHSAGAYYAQAMAARRPAQIAGLALVCPLLPGLRDVPEHRVVAGSGEIGDDAFRSYFVIQTPEMLERYERYVAPAAALADQAALARIGERWTLTPDHAPRVPGSDRGRGGAAGLDGRVCRRRRPRRPLPARLARRGRRRGTRPAPRATGVPARPSHRVARARRALELTRNDQRAGAVHSGNSGYAALHNGLAPLPRERRPS